MINIEKYKDQYRQPQATVPVTTQDSQELIVTAVEIKRSLLKWVQETMDDPLHYDLEIKEVKDLAAIVNSISASLAPPPVEEKGNVNILIQNFLDGQIDDC